MPTTAPPVLDVAAWQPLADAHAERADAFTAGRRERRSRQQKHAIEDFLFEYYPVTPAALRRWHPGVGVALDASAPHTAWRWYRTADGAVTLDVDAFRTDRGDAVRFIHGLLTATMGRPALTGCFGLHEWAMVYRESDEHRHPLPLRLGAAGTDAVVETHRIRCTHFDAYRFFTPDAVERNTLRPTRDSMTAMEQPGCLHAGMDVYKWATKLGPAVPGDLLLDCFELARDIRTLDMQASPYDVTTYGLDPVAIETPEGKAEYVARQRGFAERGNVLRMRLVAVCAAVLA
jgi:hypothetical protein